MTNALRAQGTYIQRGNAATQAAITLNTITTSGNVATATTAAAHGLATGSNVTFSGVTPSAYNGTYIVTVLTPTTFTFTTGVAAGGAATVVGAYTAQNITFATIEETQNIMLGGLTVSAIDATHLLSLAKEFIAGLSDSGNCDMTCNFTNGATQSLVRADANAGVVSPYRIVAISGVTGAPTTTTVSFLGFVTKYAGPSAKVDGKLEISITIKISGPLTFVTV